MEKKIISVEELRLGMYVSELDRPWLDTPFLFQGFPITSWGQIEELKKHCRTVFDCHARILFPRSAVRPGQCLVR